jgi:uncharacterized membrane protein SirB2
VEVIKTIHVLSAGISILGFFIRGVLMMFESSLMQARWIRIIPHFVDTVLLLSAIWLAVDFGFSPTNSPWLAAKIIALLIYIGLGFVALRLGKTKQIRVTAWFAALVVFGYIVLVAINKSPVPIG